MKKIHAWLAEHRSHDIYDAAMAARALEAETGYKADWNGSSPAALCADIKARGLGGSFTGTRNGIAGYEMAEALARKHCGFRSDKEGRGRRFWESIEALKTANI